MNTNRKNQEDKKKYIEYIDNIVEPDFYYTTPFQIMDMCTSVELITLSEELTEHQKAVIRGHMRRIKAFIKKCSWVPPDNWKPPKEIEG